MGRNYMRNTTFADLLGKTLTAIEGGVGDETLTFVCSDGEKYVMHYFDDCCASCNVEDICGDVNDLIGTPIVRAEAPSSLDNFDEAKAAQGDSNYMPESYTWTFFILGTTKGTVTIRWFGSSNGYYSESPTFYLDEKDE